MACKLVVLLSFLVILVLAEEYRPEYSPPAAQYAPAPVYNYGPDNAEYYYAVETYDPYLYKNALLNFNRYPGGAAYQLKEDGKGSYVNVNVETFRAGGAYNNKGY